MRRWLPRCMKVLGLAVALLATTSASANPSCRDPWVTAALKSLGKGGPADTGNNGLCNIARYRGGSWSNQGELNDLVRQSFACNDPWIGQVYAEPAMGSSRPNGSGASGECNPVNYGGGSWSSYADLRAKARAYKTSTASAPPRPAVVAPAPPASPAAMAKTARNGWSEKGGQWERCFGAVGPGCEGAPGAGITRNPNGTITAHVAVGSILHDNCCMRNGPAGVWCGGIKKALLYDELSIPQHVFGHCSQEWSKAVYNVRDKRMWRATFGPYTNADGGDDLSQTGNRHAKMSVANSPLFVDYKGGETTSSRALLAPSGTALDIDDVAFCQSGQFSERHDHVVGIGRWGRCK